MSYNVGQTNTPLFQVNKEEPQSQCLYELKPLEGDLKGDILFICLWLIEMGIGIFVASV